MLGDIVRRGYYLLDSRCVDVTSYKSTPSRPSSTQTVESEDDPDDSGTAIEEDNFNVEDYEEVDIWLPIL